MTPAERELLLMIGARLATTAAEWGRRTEADLFRGAVDQVMADERARPAPDGRYAELVQILKLRMAELLQRPN